MAEQKRLEMNCMKRISPAELQEVIAEAVSRVLGEKHIVSIANVEFTNLGATVTMSILRDISWPEVRTTDGGAGGAGGTSGGPPRA